MHPFDLNKKCTPRGSARIQAIEAVNRLSENRLSLRGQFHRLGHEQQEAILKAILHKRDGIGDEHGIETKAQMMESPQGTRFQIGVNGIDCFQNGLSPLTQQGAQRLRCLP